MPTFFRFSAFIVRWNFWNPAKWQTNELLSREAAMIEYEEMTTHSIRLCCRVIGLRASYVRHVKRNISLCLTMEASSKLQSFKVQRFAAAFFFQFSVLFINIFHFHNSIAKGFLSLQIVLHNLSPSALDFAKHKVFCWRKQSIRSIISFFNLIILNE